MDIFRLRCFVKAAETLNYSQTAREMFITQSAVTQQVAAIEKELGVKLFRKTGRYMSLTEAGKEFLIGAKSILSAYDDLCLRVSRTDAMEKELRIGYHGPLNWGTMLSLIQAFSEVCPDVGINIRTDHWGVLVHDLSQGVLDFAFTEQSEMKSYPQLAFTALFREGCCVCMSRDNPLAAHSILYPELLADQALIMTTSPKTTASMDTMISRLTESGIDMEHARYVNQFETALTMAGANMGVTFVPRSFKVYEHPLLKYTDLDTPYFYMDMGLAYLPRPEYKAHSAFLKLCKGWDFTGEAK